MITISVCSYNCKAMKLQISLPSCARKSCITRGIIFKFGVYPAHRLTSLFFFFQFSCNQWPNKILNCGTAKPTFWQSCNQNCWSDRSVVWSVYATLLSVTLNEIFLTREIIIITLFYQRGHTASPLCSDHSSPFLNTVPSSGLPAVYSHASCNETCFEVSGWSLFVLKRDTWRLKMHTHLIWYE